MLFSETFKTILESKKKLLIPVVGIFVNTVFNTYLYDYLFYPYMIWKLGIVTGGIVMTILSTFICYLFLKFYDWSKKDWLGIETLKQVREYTGCSRVGRFACWVMKKGDWAAMLLLSIQFDPFITVAYMRQGSNRFDGMKKRDWQIFFASAIIANVYWTLVAFAGVSLLELVWKLI